MVLYLSNISRYGIRVIIFALISLLAAACGGGSGNGNGNGSTASANSAPQISGTPALSVVEDSAYSFIPTYSDQEGNALTFSITNKPVWATFNSSTGALTGTPNNAHIGISAGIVIRVSDGVSNVALPAFDITVTAKGVGTVNLSWTAPTTYTDNTPMNDLTGYEIHYGTTTKNYSTVINVVGAGTTSYTINNLAPGTYFFVVRAVTSSAKSAFTPELSKVIAN